MTKIIHNFAADGLYIGSSPADVSPREAGVYLIPAMSTEVALPKHDPVLEQCRFTGESWTVEGIPAAVATEIVDQPTQTPTPAQITIAKIAALESSVNDRRLREAVLGIDGGWLKALNDQVSELRAQLVTTQ